MECVATIIDFIVSVDQQLTLSINAVHTSVTDVIWMVFSEVSFWAPLYVIVAFFMIKFLGWQRGLVAIFAAILTLVCCDQFANLIKDSVCRLRPCHDPLMIDAGLRVLENPGGKYGFFSAHSANAFGFALCSYKCFKLDNTHNYKPYLRGMLIWASMLSISRVFVGKHFLGDVLVGILVGIGFALLISYVAKLLVHRINI